MAAALAGDARMSAALHQFHFLQPWWLFALAALPLLLWLGTRGGTAQQELSRLVDAELLPHLLHGRANSRRLPLGLFALGWTLGVLALAGPTWSRLAEPLYANRAAQVVAISLSQRMLARDVPPSRIDRARYKARDLLESNRDGLNGLIGYAGESFVVAPLTSDAHSLDDLLDAMAPDVMPVDGDNAAQAIEQGAKLIRDAKAKDGSLVLITDDADAAAQAAARKAWADGVRISVLGVGTPQGAPVPLADGSFLHDAQGNLVLAHRDDAALRALAVAGGGRYVPMSDDGADVAALHAELQPSQHATLAAGVQGDAWQDRGPWLLLPLLLVVALAFRRGWLLLLPLVWLPLWPMPAHAADWRDWWQRPDQQAASALRAGQAAKAQHLARDPAWRGAAAYRAGDYAAAAQALQQAKGTDAPYNLGNALAELGKYPEAIKAYDRALQLNPHNEDARANRKAVEDAMRRQQQQQQQSQSSQDKHGQGGQSGSKQGAQNRSGQNDQGQQGQNSSQQNASQGQQSGQQSSGQQPSKPQQQGGQNGQGQQDQPNQSDRAPSGQGNADTRQAPDQQGKADASSSASQPPSNPQQQAQQQAQAAKAQQALQRQMNQALAQRPGQSQQNPPAHELGAAAADDPLSKLPADIRQALQRVPDDPGALLRRKFALEYQERHAGQSAQDGQP
jgi:Ca-activated chloride channel homolog